MYIDQATLLAAAKHNVSQSMDAYQFDRSYSFGSIGGTTIYHSIPQRRYQSAVFPVRYSHLPFRTEVLIRARFALAYAVFIRASCTTCSARSGNTRYPFATRTIQYYLWWA